MQNLFARLAVWRTAIALGALVATIACATAGNNTTHLHEMNVVVKNNLPTPTRLTIYAVNGSISRRLGDVASNDSTLLKWVPPSTSGTYRFVAERPLERPLRSQPFTIGSDVGTIQWTLVPNILGFVEPNVIDTLQVDSAGVR